MPMTLGSKCVGRVWGLRTGETGGVSDGTVSVEGAVAFMVKVEIPNGAGSVES